MGQDSCYKSLAIVQDRLGWDCFVEGHIYKLFLQVMKPCLREVGRRSVDQWGQDFVKSLLHLTHKQWLFRNARKHIRLMDGMTEAEHLEVYDRVEELIHLDPTDLLPKHQYLLDDDFSKMGESSSIAWKVWVLNVESALAAANSVKGGTAIADDIARFIKSLPLVNPPFLRQCLNRVGGAGRSKKRHHLLSCGRTSSRGFNVHALQ